MITFINSNYYSDRSVSGVIADKVRSRNDAPGAVKIDGL